MYRLLSITSALIVHALAQQQTTESTLLEGPSDDYVDRGQDGSYKFGYKNLDSGSHHHTAAASRDNTVSGRFGSRDPASRRIVQTTYTAGNRGFRARGPNVARQMDLSQVKIPYQPPVPVDSPNYQPSYDGYHDPNEDPSYKFSVKTATASRGETADSKGTVNGAYSYIDDVGKRHDVQYEAGSRTGFHVKTPFPDSEPFNGIFYQGPNKPGTPPRGHSSIMHGTDGSYQFTASGPDQKQIEVSDAAGRRRGSYTYIDDKGVQRTVQYVAGPNIGYKVIRKGAASIYNSLYPYPGPNFLVPPSLPLPESTVTPSVSTTTPSSTFASDLFDPLSSSFVDGSISGSGTIDLSTPEGDGSGNDFLGPTNKPFTTPTYHPTDLSTERPNYWTPKPFYTTLKPPKIDAPDYFSSLNPQYRISATAPSSTEISASDSSSRYRPSHTPFSDLFGDKPTDHDSSLNNFQQPPPPPPPVSSYDGPPKRPSNAYLYPKPDKSFNEQPDKGGFLIQNDNRYSETNKNFLGLPPGTAVRAHVQSLDILPYGSKIPPPDETLLRHLFEEQRRDRYEYFTVDQCIYVRKVLG